MGVEMNSQDFEEFMRHLISLVPVDQHPTDIVVPDIWFHEATANGNAMYAPTHMIHIRKKSSWDAERKYKSELDDLKSRVEKLERR